MVKYMVAQMIVHVKFLARFFGQTLQKFRFTSPDRGILTSERQMVFAGIADDIRTIGIANIVWDIGNDFDNNVHGHLPHANRLRIFAHFLIS
jgi:hypothetical protein